MTESQRAMVAAALANMPVGGDTVSDHSANLRNAQTSIAEAADLLNVSERSVNTAKKVAREGSPELIDAVQKARFRYLLRLTLQRFPNRN